MANETVTLYAVRQCRVDGARKVPGDSVTVPKADANRLIATGRLSADKPADKPAKKAAETK